MIAAAALVALVMSVPPSSEPLPEGYVPLVDSTQSLVIAVPEAWGDIEVAPIPLEDGSELPYIAASTDLASLYEGEFTAPGVMYAGFPHTDNLLQLINDFGPPRNCVSMETKEYSDPLYLGVVQIGHDCGAQHMTWYMVVANHIGEPHYTAVVQIQTADDVERTTVLRTFNVGPNAVVVFVPPSSTTAASTTVAPTTVAPTTT